MNTKDFYYDLPKERIAQKPLKNRLDSRLLVLNRKTNSYADSMFRNLGDHLKKGDVLVLNDSAVIPARLYGIKEDTKALVEVLLLKPLSLDRYEAIVKKARKIHVGTRIVVGDNDLVLECLEEKEEGIRIFKMIYEGEFYALLDRLGEMPLPPYIHERLDDTSRYQTVYAKEQGSAAAPTAGLHFTHTFLNELAQKGVIITAITLHVGLGTFRPVKVKNVEDHKMHEEVYKVTKETAEILNRAKKDDRRIIAVGTTVLRTLETELSKKELFEETEDVSEIFIYPGFTFKAVDGLITNFHLPESTLMMLVSAFASKSLIFDAYHHAINEEYRFFSFGDAMIIL